MKTSMKGGSPKGSPSGSKPGSAGMKTQKVMPPTNKQSKASNNIPKGKSATK